MMNPKGSNKFIIKIFGQETAGKNYQRTVGQQSKGPNTLVVKLETEIN
jgi:hypothetical protein